MRCPKCEERNSVAARKCEYCGERFKKKPAPVGLKLAAGGLAVAASVSLLASYLVPKLIDPEQNLVRVAKRLAAGPKSPDDAKQIRKEFVEALMGYLKHNGSAGSHDLTSALQKSLDSTAFEVHVVDLPRGSKLVEVDTLLQATDFLVMKTNGGTKVFDLPEFEVFDDARILNDSAGPVLALLGHSGGPPPHRPMVRTYAVLPESVTDETEKLVPVFGGEGTAKFDKNGQDIRFDLSLQSVAKSDNISLDTTTRDEVVHEYLRWKDARYSPSTDLSNYAGGIAYQVAKSMHHPEIAQTTDLGSGIISFVKANPQQPAQQIILASMGNHKGKPSYRIDSNGQQFILALQRNGSRFAATELRAADKSEIAHVSPAVTFGSASVAAKSVAPASAVGGVSSPAPAAPTPGLAAQVVQPSAVTSTPASQQLTKRSADKKIVVRGLTEAGTKMAAGLPPDSGAGAAIASPSLLASPKAAVANIAATAKSVQEKLSSKHSKRGHDHDAAQQTATASGGGGHVATISGAMGATLRASGSTGAKALSNLSRGDSVEILGRKGDWYRARYQGHEGYVYAALVSQGSAGEPKSSSRRHGRDHDRTAVVAANTESHSSGHEHGRHKHGHANANSHDDHKQLAMVMMPEPAVGKHHSEDKHKTPSTSSSKSSHNKVKMATVEPILVP